MALQFATTGRNNMMDGLVSSIGSNALFRVYTGVIPLTCATALSGNTVLGELPCSATFAPAASGGVLTVNAITTDASADATGTATFFRLFRSNGTTVEVQGTVGTSGADLNMNTVDFTVGGAISITSAVWTAPGA